MPFLNVGDFKANMKKADTTKKRRETPKNIFMKNSGLLLVALCILVNFSIPAGSCLDFQLASPVDLL